MGRSNSPDVTVVVATRNRFEWLRECVDSVRLQKGIDWELVIVDDCSDDGQAERLNELEGERTYIFLQPEPGERCTTRNRGLEAAKGRYVMFLDDDDRLRPGALAALAAALDRHEDAVAAAGARWVLFAGEDYERRDTHPRRTLKRDVLEDLLFGWSSVSGQNLYRTPVVRSIGGYSGPIPCEDRMLWLEVASVGKVVLCPETVLTYRYHALQQRPDNILEIRDQVAEYAVLKRPEPQQRRLRNLRASGRQVEEAELALSRGEFGKAMVACLQAFARTPRIFFSPLIGEWTIRRLGGRLVRRFFPAKSA